MIVKNSVVCLLCILPVISQNQKVSLSPIRADVFENANVTLTCRYYATFYTFLGIFKDVTWFKRSRYTFEEVAKVHVRESSSGYYESSDSKKFYTSSWGRGNTILTLYNVTRKQHSEEWKCSTGWSYDSNSAFLYVKIPLTSVHISDPSLNILTVQEHEHLTLVCETSPGRPPANITWIEANETNAVKRIPSYIKTTAVADNLIISKSELILSPDRFDDQNTIHCEGNNTGGITNAISSRKIRLNVQFILETSLKIIDHDNGSIITMIEQRQETLSCATPGGNQSPLLWWSCYNVGTSLSSEDQVINNVTWTAVRDSDRRCTCYSSHVVAGNHSVYVDVEVLFPPTTPRFMIDSKEVSGSIEIVRGNAFALKCQNSGKPAPNVYWEGVNVLEMNSSTLTFDKIKTADEGQYTCFAINTMESSSGEIITGRKHSNIKIIVISPVSQSQSKVAVVGGSAAGGVVVLVALAIVVFVGKRRNNMCGTELPEVREEETPAQTYESLFRSPVHDNTACHYETLVLGQMDDRTFEVMIPPTNINVGDESYINMEKLQTIDDSKVYANVDEC